MTIVNLRCRLEAQAMSLVAVLTALTLIGGRGWLDLSSWGVVFCGVWEDDLV